MRPQLNVYCHKTIKQFFKCLSILPVSVMAATPVLQLNKIIKIAITKIKYLKIFPLKELEIMQQYYNHNTRA